MKNILRSFFLLGFITPFSVFSQQNFAAYEQPITGTSLSIKMSPIPGGTCLLGSSVKEKGHENDENPQKTVKVDSFWMATYEITHDQFELFLDEDKDGAPKPDAITRPSPPYIDFTLGMGKQGGFPASSMSQYSALMYCKWLYLKTGIFYRLPTEAEWEYACRAGASTTYPFGNDAKKLTEYGWFAKNSSGKYHKVGELKPNAWGLYDMLGNMQEWTLDEYRADYLATIKEDNPSVLPTSRHPRTLKGGSYESKDMDLRPANRIVSDLVWNRRDPQIPRSKWWNTDAPFLGFRIIRPVKQPSKEEIEAFFKLYLN